MDRQLEISSGGVVFRRDESGFEVALTQTTRGPMWCLPKGRVEPEETLEQAALREVREETGLVGEIRCKLRPIEYSYQARSDEGRRRAVDKTVHFFLVEFQGGSVEDHDHEVADVRWFPLHVAGRLLHHAGERDVLALAKRALENGHSD
ncbi:MAG: NUDIX domain-containing protein [Gemmatimonadetes bacterium]|nr:NUDIX domain-containing protein [Gemmatimonadota bacterium]